MGHMIAHSTPLDELSRMVSLSAHLDEYVKSYGGIFGTASAPERVARSLAQVSSPLPRSARFARSIPKPRPRPRLKPIA